MDIKPRAWLSAALFLGLLQISEEFFSGSISCCTEHSDQISRGLLQRVRKFEIQQNNGLCNIRAVVLYTKHKVLCANPDNVLLNQWIEKRKGKEKKKKNISWGSKKKRKGKKKRGKSIKRKNRKPTKKDKKKSVRNHPQQINQGQAPPRGF
ncbi:hypothetical protein XENTR_v10002968 [Xenopus tropicalis]|uniref:C-C motif chemokine 27 n=1 Tax=Xenopus tropicalis TaxID=8364 RepID=A0A8J0QZG4_XENTR|nr:C-C motif chemokine 27 [Xenopus tropicalis]KAE8636386.1 hypothetical protein XENTR_v10002968 [Xenopus tropicalis]|eukprot:XP_004910497.1 PREDICTED: C-C motif chemokine 27 [Xenopus tropicalis]